MKKLLSLIFVLFTINSFSQLLVENIHSISNNPNYYNFELRAYDTHFSSADSNLIIFTNYNDSVVKWVKLSVYAEENFISQYFYNTSFPSKGYYDLIVYNNIDDTMFLENALFITDGTSGFNASDIKKCFTDSSYTLDLSVYSINLNSVSSGQAFFISKSNDTINIDSIEIINAYQIAFHFTTNSSMSGLYSLYYYNNLDTLTKENAIFIKNINLSHISYLNPDPVDFNSYWYDTIFVFGKNTHFTNDSNLVYFDIGFMSYIMSNYNVVNDTTLFFQLNALIVKSWYDSTAYISIYNPIDSLMQYPYKLYIAGSTKNIEEKNNIKLYPNPSSNIINLELEDYNNESIEYKVYSIDMKLIKFDKFNSNKHSINIGDLNIGIYFIEIITDNKRSIQKFIKQ